MNRHERRNPNREVPPESTNRWKLKTRLRFFGGSERQEETTQYPRLDEAGLSHIYAIGLSYQASVESWAAQQGISYSEALRYRSQGKTPPPIKIYKRKDNKEVYRDSDGNEYFVTE